jgi:hypothetical protein
LNCPFLIFSASRWMFTINWIGSSDVGGIWLLVPVWRVSERFIDSMLARYLESTTEFQRRRMESPSAEYPDVISGKQCLSRETSCHRQAPDDHAGLQSFAYCYGYIRALMQSVDQLG